jgi:hypothetical protein
LETIAFTQIEEVMDSSCTGDLSLIYSQLSILSSFEKKTHADIIEEVMRRHALKPDTSCIAKNEWRTVDSSIQPILRCLEEHIQEEGNEFSPSESFDDALDQLRKLFSCEREDQSRLASQISSSIDQYQLIVQENDRFNADIVSHSLRMKELPSQIRDFTDLCRKLQSLNNEKSCLSASSLAEEKSKTLLLRTECEASLLKFSTNVDAEEAQVSSVEAQNTELCTRLEDFQKHLSFRREKARNEEKTRMLLEQLRVAKLEQRRYLDEQREQTAHKLAARIASTRETIAYMATQARMLKGKFDDFRNTVDSSSEVLSKLSAKEEQLRQDLSVRQKDLHEWEHRARDSEMHLIRTITQSQDVRDETKSFRLQYDKLQQQCRTLQLKRKEVLMQRCSESATTRLKDPSSDGDEPRWPAVGAVSSQISSSGSHKKGIEDSAGAGCPSPAVDELDASCGRDVASPG